MSNLTATRFVAFDLETTGVDAFSDRPVSFGFVERSADGGYLEIGGLINPGVAIPDGASRVHGISDQMVKDAPSLEESIGVVSDVIFEVWASGGVIVGMNISYDLTMVDSVRVAHGLTPLSPLGAVADVLVADRHFDRWRRGPRKLSDLCTHYGVTLDGAHAALDDARASLLVLEEQFRRYPEFPRLDVTRMNSEFADWYREWLASFSTYLEKKGEAPISQGRYAWPVHERESPR